MLGYAMKGDTQRAVSFLRDFHPDRIWLLTAIDPDSKRIESESFTPDQLHAASQWIQKWNGNRT